METDTEDWRDAQGWEAPYAVNQNSDEETIDLYRKSGKAKAGLEWEQVFICRTREVGASQEGRQDMQTQRRKAFVKKMS